ncbi:unnamed protein product, partial [marine sediment metagenome]
VVGSTPGEAVWDSNFKCVLHLSESSGTIIDSTNNDNDASISGDGVTQGTPQKIGPGVALAGSDDYLMMDTAGLGSAWAEFTTEIYGRFDSVGGGVDRALIGAWGGTNGDLFLLYYDSTGSTQMRYIIRPEENTTTLSVYYGSSPPLADTWYYHAGTYKQNDDAYGWENGSPSSVGGVPDEPINTQTTNIRVGVDGNDGKDLDGKVDEIRISDTVRSTAWIVATRESGNDDLLDWSSEELENNAPNSPTLTNPSNNTRYNREDSVLYEWDFSDP